MKVQVRCVGVTAVAEVAHQLSGGEPIAGLHGDRTGLQVCVEGVVPVTDVLHHMVAAVLLQS